MKEARPRVGCGAPGGTPLSGRTFTRGYLTITKRYTQTEDAVTILHTCNVPERWLLALRCRGSSKGRSSSDEPYNNRPRIFSLERKRR